MYFLKAYKLGAYSIEIVKNYSLKNSNISSWFLLSLCCCPKLNVLNTYLPLKLPENKVTETKHFVRFFIACPLFKYYCHLITIIIIIIIQKTHKLKSLNWVKSQKRGKLWDKVCSYQ